MSKEEQIRILVIIFGISFMLGASVVAIALTLIGNAAAGK